ncbi:MAG: hypothetical protein M1504_01845 [Candidatus Marsarchaeota archaeon]|nr:hypothetical protein [Candidatus Marsarchaeota archaeon]
MKPEPAGVGSRSQPKPGIEQSDDWSKLPFFDPEFLRKEGGHSRNSVAQELRVSKRIEKAQQRAMLRESRKKEDAMIRKCIEEYAARHDGDVWFGL